MIEKLCPGLELRTRGSRVIAHIWPAVVLAHRGFPVTSEAEAACILAAHEALIAAGQKGIVVVHSTTQGRDSLCPNSEN